MWIEKELRSLGMQRDRISSDRCPDSAALRRHFENCSWSQIAALAYQLFTICLSAGLADVSIIWVESYSNMILLCLVIAN